mgnify:FL=1
MGITVDVAYKSLNKYTEILCGDKVELLQTEDSNIMILADGMGSGVKANILSTLTSKILGTMFLNGATLEECVDTISETLPICQVRQVAYSTFSILQVYHNGDAYLVEYDNPRCIFIRDGEIMKIPEQFRMIDNRRINEYHFKVKLGDAFILISDGAINAGVGELLNFGWNWDSVAKYAQREYKKTISAMHLAAAISQACDDLYQYRPGDDTTVAVLRIGEKKLVNLMTGPAQCQEDDEGMVTDFMADENAVKVVCGGTSANIVARVLEKEINVAFTGEIDPNIPPTASIEGIDLVTEGVVTMNRFLKLLEQYTRDDEIDEAFFIELDKPNGASMLAKLLIEQCTDLHLFVGKAVNAAYQNTELPFQLGVRQKLVDQIEDVLKRLGKGVSVRYY